MRFIYLASPYSAVEGDKLEEHASIRQRNYEAVMKHVALNSKSIPLYSPILHYHELTKFYNMPTDAEYWWENNKCFIEPALEVQILKLPRWWLSKGVLREIEYCAMIGKTLSFVEPNVD